MEEKTYQSRTPCKRSWQCFPESADSSKQWLQEVRPAFIHRTRRLATKSHGNNVNGHIQGFTADYFSRQDGDRVGMRPIWEVGIAW